MTKINLPTKYGGMDTKEAYNRVISKKEDDSAKLKPKAENSIVINSTDYWTITGVNYRGKNRNYHLAKQLLPAGTQDEHAQNSLASKTSGGFYTADSQLHFALFEALHNARTQPDSEQARQFIQQKMRTNWLTTLTRIGYNPSGKDKITYNYKMLDEYSLMGNIVGENGFMKDVSDREYLECLLGTQYLKKINRIFEYINGTEESLSIWSTDGYIGRINNKPSSIDERVVGFDAVTGKVFLDCSGYPSFSVPCFGVREAP